ncbi:MAG: histidine kinase [Deltaproteobacteria bacterium HGW-Deltaproteobacteria-15]|jgi:signal transduction histidine kinase|nr:MAG: histidine kinase [Deltaproteobacteria bacterium HGW-Deltaproteobacteria-15]
MKTLLTLKTKLVFLFLVLALVPLGIIGMFSIDTTEALIESLVLRQLENVASDKAALLERWVEERKQDMQVIAATSLLKSMDPKVIAPYLELVQAHYGVYNNMTVASSENKIVFSTQATDPIADITAWTTGPEALVLSPITYLPREKESSFRIAAPIFDKGDRIGTVFGTVGTNKIITIILQAALGKTGECYIVDKNGIFLAHKEPQRILTENISQSESFKNIFESRDRKRTYLDYRNIEVLGTSRKIGGTDWHIVVEQDRDEAFQSMDGLKRHVYFTIFLAIGSTLLLTWVISYHIVRPVRSLSQLANKLATADSDMEPIKTNRQDEIGVLCRAFADMAQKIQQRQDSLEEKFNLKTAELKETDHTLKQFKLIAERSEKFAALGRLGAAVAHEIRTPLTSLKLFLESIHAEIEISPEYTEDFTVAMGQINRIEGAINRLLDYTKPKELIFSEICIAHLITDIVSMIRPLANKQECVVETRMAPGLPEINGDKKLLEEALVNLFINSLEAMPEKGRINVTAEMDVFDSDGNPISCIRIDIADSGPGIAPENVDFIFEPFFTTKSAGTGLGLPMVFNTVKRHDGEIRVSNREEGGALVSIFLPVKSQR